MKRINTSGEVQVDPVTHQFIYPDQIYQGSVHSEFEDSNIVDTTPEKVPDEITVVSPAINSESNDNSPDDNESAPSENSYDIEGLTKLTIADLSTAIQKIDDISVLKELLNIETRKGAIDAIFARIAEIEE